MEESVRRVAARVKRWRADAAISLQELANRSGVSPSTIHKIEHCQTVPTIAVVLKLANGLARHPTEFFDDADECSTTLHLRRGDRTELITSRGVRVQALAGDPASRDIAVWRVAHPPGFSFGGRTMRHLAGEVVILLEQGRLRVTVGDEEFSLEAGDSLHFKASSEYAWCNDGDEEAVAVILGNTADAVRPALVAQLRHLGGDAHVAPRPARAPSAEAIPAPA